jgi:integrase
MVYTTCAAPVLPVSLDHVNHQGMRMRQKLTPAFVMNPPKPSKGRVVYWDTTQPGFGLRVTSTGHRSYIMQYRAGGGRDGVDRKATIAGTLSLADARKEAKKIAGAVATGADPVDAKRQEQAAKKIAAGTTVKAILEGYLTVECGMVHDEDGNATFSGRLRSAPQRLDAFERLVWPRIGDSQIGELKRSQVVGMLDQIAKENGPVMADRTLAYVRKALNWYASRTDDFRSPIVKGMAKTKPKERAGRRVLADDEIRDIWTVCEKGGKELPDAFCRLQRCLFLAAVRRTEAAAMSWFEMESLTRDDFNGDAWTVPAGRMKGKIDHLVPVTAALAAIIGEQPKDWRKRPYVFSTTGGRRPFSGYSKGKTALDREIAALRKREGRDPMRPWTMQRDVRRTARTLLTRAGVSSEIAERVLAHEIPGVEGVYNRYEYVAEKHNALDRLAALIERIVHPQDNVTEMRTLGRTPVFAGYGAAG